MLVDFCNLIEKHFALKPLTLKTGRRERSKFAPADHIYVHAKYGVDPTTRCPPCGRLLEAELFQKTELFDNATHKYKGKCFVINLNLKCDPKRFFLNLFFKNIFKNILLKKYFEKIVVFFKKK